MGRIIDDAWAEAKKDGFVSIETEDSALAVSLSEYDRICEDLKAKKEWIEVTNVLGFETLIKASSIIFVVYCNKDWAAMKEADRQEELIKGER